MPPGLLVALALLGAAVAGPPPRYAVVTSRRTYAGAQALCRQTYRGQLASVHSAPANEELRALARTRTRHSLWIGAVTRRAEGRWDSRWEDASPWNYANWAPRQPCRLFPTCATLSPRDGLWRSSLCVRLRPFICQY
ncbi:bone marrow proteoglycan-like [Apteryx mantelli]|uniref:Bone marrow proteoglycan-like n=1 Tax=Apteryx mantelli TaxID=2696672 RepID=A0ABM4EFF6_9AVES